MALSGYFNKTVFGPLVVLITAMGLFCTACADDLAVGKELQVNDGLPPWSEGMLDIYHINTGRGDAAFLIFPDGTTMLYDAGDLDADEFEVRAYPLVTSPQRPSKSVAPGTAIAQFIQSVLPEGKAAQIDYAIVSHFHGDHYGTVRPGLPQSKFGPYVLTGITDVAETVPIKTLIDRGYPNYNSPTDLRACHGVTFENYMAFRAAQEEKRGMTSEQLLAGSDDQIALKRYPEKYPKFKVRNIKSNARLWTGEDEEVVQLFDPSIMLDERGKFTENPLSLALRISYGDFDYFTGGDMTGLQGAGTPDWFDVESPTAKSVGEVDVLALNHHGNRDATNEAFLAALMPRIIVQQSWTSDHPGGEVLQRMTSKHIWEGNRDIFSTNMANETKVALGPIMTKAYASFEGHVMLRVSEGGKSYMVYTLDDSQLGIHVTGTYGPYESRN